MLGRTRCSSILAGVESRHQLLRLSFVSGAWWLQTLGVANVGSVFGQWLRAHCSHGSVCRSMVVDASDDVWRFCSPHDTEPLPCPIAPSKSLAGAAPDVALVIVSFDLSFEADHFL